MSVVVVRYRTKPERAEENAALIEKVFGELNAENPEGLRYASFRLADGVSFVHVASIETKDGTNPLNASPAFAEFQREIGDRLEDGPYPSGATVVGSFRFWPGEGGS
ncbi:MAG TPA: hypothetical protein VID75_01625 [Acidimicrobiales bacterium]|jgi:hypothetical protein